MLAAAHDFCLAKYSPGGWPADELNRRCAGFAVLGLCVPCRPLKKGWMFHWRVYYSFVRRLEA